MPEAKRKLDPIKSAIYVVITGLIVCGLSYHYLGFDALSYLPDRSFCPFKIITGIDCPGCGITRAILSISQLKFAQAIEFNYLSFILLISMILYLFKNKLKIKRLNPKLLIVILTIMISVWLFRLLLQFSG